MITIQQLKEKIALLNDEKLLDQFDLYNRFQLNQINEIIYKRIIECELENRNLLAHKIIEDQFEMECNV